MNTKKIYFVEKSTAFNSNDLNSHLIAGSEKTLINISSELSKYDNLEIKVFNLTKQMNINTKFLLHFVNTKINFLSYFLIFLIYF